MGIHLKKQVEKHEEILDGILQVYIDSDYLIELE